MLSSFSSSLLPVTQLTGVPAFRHTIGSQRDALSLISISSRQVTVSTTISSVSVTSRPRQILSSRSLQRTLSTTLQRQERSSRARRSVSPSVTLAGMCSSSSGSTRRRSPVQVSLYILSSVTMIMIVTRRVTTRLQQSSARRWDLRTMHSS